MATTTTHQRPFADILNEWTETVLELNRQAQGNDLILLISRLGVLGQNLIFEANLAGIRDTAKVAKENISGNTR